MRKIAALAEAHYVTVAPHNPMGPLATAVNLHFAMAQPNFKILEYRLPPGAAPGTRPELREGPLPAGGRLSPAPSGPAGLGRRDRRGLPRHRRYLHWERAMPVKPDGALGYP